VQLLLSFCFQAEDGIRDFHVTGVQTCALPILIHLLLNRIDVRGRVRAILCLNRQFTNTLKVFIDLIQAAFCSLSNRNSIISVTQIGRASCRETCTWTWRPSPENRGSRRSATSG